MSQAVRPLVAAAFSYDFVPSSVKRDDNTVLIIWGARHGNRNPEQFLDVNHRTWGFEGTMELTSWGKKQAYGLGRELRSFVGNLCDLSIDNEKTKYYSSSASRCQMTLQAAMAGFHDLADVQSLQRTVEYTIDDKLLRTYSLSDCSNIKKVWEPINNDRLPQLKEKKKEKKELIGYITENTKWTVGHLGIVADVADNIIGMDLYSTEYPDWMARPTIKGYTKERLRREILQFAEIHQYACADYEPCRKLMAGMWLGHILNHIEDAIEGRGPVVVGYISHTEITMSVMKQMGIQRDELTTSAGFVIEFRMKPFPSLRLLNHDPNPLENHVIYKAKYGVKLAEKADKDGFIPLKDFLTYIRPKVIIDWSRACGEDIFGL